MVAIASGLWWDHSKTTILAATLTLPLNYSNLLLSGLTILVTIAGSSFWNIVAFALHDWKARSANPSALDLQHQVSLRNSAGATQTLWEAFKIHKAWSKNRKKPIIKQTCSVVVPALIVSAGFAVAALFTSRVANKAYSNVVRDGGKRAKRHPAARSHVANFYANTSSSTAPSIFIRPTLPYDISIFAPYPFPARDRCIPGPDRAFSITSDFLSSHEMLGINAKFEDRVSIQLSLTYSPVHTDDLTQETGNEDGDFMEFFLGPIYGATNYTYRYNKAIGNKTGIGYLIHTTQLSTADRILYSLAQSNTYTTVANLGTAALWANNMVTGHVSFGLPEDQWKTEVIGWFQTNLAMLQAHVVDFASNTADLGPFGYVEPPRNSHLQDQCTKQLVRAVGEVQNFSVCGMLIIVCVSAALILLDCSLERIVDFVDDFYERDSVAGRARQGDNKLHLLRMALGGDDWTLGRWGIPVRDNDAKYNRPCASKRLVSYGGSNTGLTGEDIGLMQVCK
ncbi:uncharacterized protein FSUBG_10790 [Fusarium subglutinans]|uniref:Uncharacterized protein n=1 Tax=Gibberella subglutinans TaxID=42677 RepID=A0A8H5P5F5_GIBSU|nr:uncharacterized protein FSUBG_10790 [Fusarium subglutinans]KAF5590574.1 hypothetical protein FSUBG_10790 [Fusarium subglutinans]